MKNYTAPKIAKPFSYDVLETDIELVQWVFTLVFRYLDNLPEAGLPDRRDYITHELDALEQRVITNIKRTTAV